MSEKEELQARLKCVIIGTCNQIGCKDCGLKFNGGCAATELDSRIMDIELMEIDEK